MKKKSKLIFALLFGVVVIGYIIYQSIAAGRGYFLEPSELMARARTDRSLEGSRLRVAGLIVLGSIKPDPAAGTIGFKIADINDPHPPSILSVVYKKPKLPANLRTDRAVMLEGKYSRRTFTADDIFNWFFSMSTTSAKEVLYVLSDRNIDVLEAKTGRAIAVIKAGSDQQLAVAPDGKRLYLADVPESGPDKGRDRLRVIETENYRTIAEAKAPDRTRTKSGPFYVPLMSLSPDGKRLYVMKTRHLKRGPADIYENWVSIISTADLREVGRIDISDTFTRFLWTDKRKLVLGLAVDRLGEAGGKDTMIVDLSKRKVVGELTRPESDPVWARGAATTDGVTFYYIKDKDGGGAGRIDIVTAASLSSPTVIRNKKLDLPPGWQASGAAVFSRDGSRLYIGVGKFSNTSRGLNDKVLVLDGRTPSLPLLGTIEPRGQFTGMAVSPAGRRLYLLNSYKESLAVYDMADVSKPRLIKTIKLKGIGQPSTVVPTLSRQR